MNAALHATRRTRLAQQLGAGAVAVLPTALVAPRNRDSDFPYRPDSYFYYLTGFTEPHAWLVLKGSGESTLFCAPKDEEREIWDGFRVGPDAARQRFGVDDAFPIDELDARLPALLEGSHTVWYPFATHSGLETRVDRWLSTVRSRVRLGAECPDTQRDLCSLLDEMRLIKDLQELELMRRAAQISAQGHVRAMQLSARALAKGEDLREYHLEAELLHEFRRHGSQFPAYSSIVAAGTNACVLHYRADSAPVRSGDLVLIDAGCELDGYASDITRTFPACGTFSSAQRDLYELVLAAQQAAVDATRPGQRFSDPHEATLRVLSQGLLDLGLLDKNKVGTLDDVLTQKSYFRFYMHRTSHWLGMDVHDCGSYIEPGDTAPIKEAEDPVSRQMVRTRPSRVLQPGMVLTIEPGLYVRAAPDVPARYHGIGIRIEDDAVVTDAGCELISRGVPVHADDIERLMKDALQA